MANKLFYKNQMHNFLGVFITSLCINVRFWAKESCAHVNSRRKVVPFLCYELGNEEVKDSADLLFV